MISLKPSDLQSAFGFGVAGNFAGHLEQAGEAADFTTVDAPKDAPKGIFPWYIPGAANGSTPAQLHENPLSSDTITVPQTGGDLQIEPEVGLVARVTYDAAGKVSALQPTLLAAFNDCSIRRPGAKKISDKKHWGPNSKGVAASGFPVSSLGEETKDLRLACFLVRDGEAHAYGQDSPVPGYSYYGTRLTGWIVDRLNNQEGAEGTPLENVGAYLQAAGNPETVLIGIGATRYTRLGESTYLKPGDAAVVVLYDGSVHEPDAVALAVTMNSPLKGASVLRQRVVNA